MRRLVIILLLVSALLLTACTYGTDFVVVNESVKPINVRYKLKIAPPDRPFYFVGNPAKVLASHLSDRRKEWHELSTGDYQLDQGTRTVTIQLSPREALRIALVIDYEFYNETQRSEQFYVEEITIAGEDGEIRFMGEQVRKAFVKDSGNLYALRYK